MKKETEDTDLNCQEVRRLLPAFVERGLEPGRVAAVRAHLDTCPACRHHWQQEREMGARLGRELSPTRRQPTQSQSWRMRHRLDHGVRRENIMIGTKNLVRGAAVLTLFAVVVGVFLWWQRGDGPIDTDSTPSPTAVNAADPDGGTPFPTAEPYTGDAVTVQFAIYDFEQQRYTGHIRDFQEQNPDIRIETVYIQDLLGLGPGGLDWPNDASRQIASAADVFGIGVNPESMAQGLLLDLRPLLEADETITADDFYPGLLEKFQWQGGLWGIPNSAGFSMIAYNKNAFAAAGLDDPQPGWTWDEFLDAANALTTGEQWGFVSPYGFALDMIEARGGPFWNLTTMPPQPRFEEPEVVDAMRWYVGLIRAHEVTPYLPFTETNDEGSTMPPGAVLVRQGRAAMWTESTSGWDFTRQDLAGRQIDAGLAPYPVAGPDDKTTPLGSTNAFGISAGTQNPEAAWRWISYLSQQTLGQSFGLPEGRPSVVPARRSVAEASGFWERVDPELGEALRFALDHSFPAQRAPFYNQELGETLVGAIEAVIEEGQTVETAMAVAQAQAEDTVTAIVLALEEGDDEGPVVVATPDRPPAGEGVLTVAFMIEASSSSERRALRTLAEQFQESHPDVYVDVQEPPQTDGFRDLAHMAPGADCLSWWSPILASQATRDAVLTLEPFLDADASLSKEDFFPLALARFSQDGQLFGLPAAVNMSVIEYDRERFDAAGVPIPTAGWTPDDFAAAAVALTQGEGEDKQYGFVPNAYELSDLISFLERAGVDLVNGQIDPAGANFDDPATVAAVRWYVALATEHGAKPAFAGDLDDSGRRQALLDAGRAAMWTDYASEHAAGRVDAHEGIAPFPAGDGAVGLPFHSSSAYFISAAAGQEERQACWQWITFLSGQADAVQAGVPARRDVAASAAYRQLAGADRADAYVAMLADSDRLYFYEQRRSADYWLTHTARWLGEAYDRILNEGVSVETALADAQAKADAYRACMIARDGQPGAQLTCAEDVDPAGTE